MRVEEIPQAILQGNPYKLARKIVEYKETSIKKVLSTYEAALRNECELQMLLFDL